MDPAPRIERRRGAEFTIAAIVFALPLVYFLTERSSEIFFWRFSKSLLITCTIYAACFAALLFSYFRALPAPIAKLRKLVVALGTSLVVVPLSWEVLLHLSDDAAFTPVPNIGRHEFDPDVGHVYLPNYDQLIQSREFSVKWHSNAQGLRADHDFGRKTAGLVRVLVVGDSFTVGDQVSFEETYPSVMQSEFDRLYGSGRVEVLNAGFPAFGTIHERKWIEKFAAGLEPDLVVVGSTPNDLLENRFPILNVALDGALVNKLASEGDRLRYLDHRRWYSLPGWVSRTLVVQRIEAMRIVDRLKGRSDSSHRGAFEIAQGKESSKLYALYEREIILARDAAARCGAKFAVLAIPFQEQLRKPGPNQDFSLWGERVKEIGARAGFPVVDLLPSFLAAPDPSALYWREDSHCRAEGYRLIGVGASASLSSLGAEVNLPRTR